MLALLDLGVEAALELACDFADVEGVLHTVGVDYLLQHEQVLYGLDVSVGGEFSGVSVRLLELLARAPCEPLLPQGNLLLAALQSPVHVALHPQELVVELCVPTHLHKPVLLLLDVVPLFAALAEVPLLLLVLVVVRIDDGILSAGHLEHF